MRLCVMRDLLGLSLQVEVEVPSSPPAKKQRPPGSQQKQTMAEDLPLSQRQALQHAGHLNSQSSDYCGKQPALCHWHFAVTEPTSPSTFRRDHRGNKIS